MTNELCFSWGWLYWKWKFVVWFRQHIYKLCNANSYIQLCWNLIFCLACCGPWLWTKKSRQCFLHGKWSVDHHTTYILLLLASQNSTVWGRVMENCMFFTCCFEVDGEVEKSKPAFSSCPWLWQVARIWVLFCFVFLVCHLMGQKVGVIQIYLVMDTFLQWQSTSHLYLWCSRGADWSIEDCCIRMCLAFQEHTCEPVSHAALSCG